MEAAGQAPTLLLESSLSQPSFPGPSSSSSSSLNGIQFQEANGDAESVPEKLTKKSRRLKKSDRSKSSSSREHHPPTPSSSTQVLPPLKRTSESQAEPEEDLDSSAIVDNAIAQLTMTQALLKHTVSTVTRSKPKNVNAVPAAANAAANSPQLPNTIVSGSLQQQQAAILQRSIVNPIPIFRPQAFPGMGSQVNPSFNPFFSQNSGLPPRSTQMQVHAARHGPAHMMANHLPGIRPGVRMGTMGRPQVPPNHMFLQQAHLNFHPHPQVVPGKDFYQLFAQTAGTNERRVSQEDLQRMKDDFLSLSLDFQMDAFNAATTITDEERMRRGRVIDDLSQYLAQKFPTAKLYIFGSMATRLCGTESDVDAVIDLHGKLLTESGTDKALIKVVQKYLENLRIPRRNRSVPVYSIQPILQARIPILKLTHLESRINIDLSFENYMSVRNSNLISLYIRLDPRILPLMIFIRYFAKFHDLSGSFLIKNYAFVLLVLNYLSNKKIVPTIEQLQQWHDTNKDPTCIIDGWNTGFCSNLGEIQKKFGKPLHKQVPTWVGILDLLYGFFKMYAELDYANCVICPLIGDTLPRDQFQPGHEEALPNCMERYKIFSSTQDFDSRFRINAALKLQDPFHLQFNVGSITPPQTLFAFRVLCATVIEMLHDFQTNKKRLPNILDLLKKLPSSVADRECYVMQQAARQRIWLSHELSTVLPEKDDEEPEFDASVQSRIIESDDPGEVPDLWLVKKLVDIGKSTASQKCGTLEFDIHRRFYQIFVRNLSQVLGEIPDQDQLINQVKLLWSHFVIEYLNQIWSTGFHMGLSMRVKWTNPPILPPEELRLPKKLTTNSPDPIPIANSEVELAPEEMNMILKELDELVKTHTAGEVYYYKISTTGTKSFYPGRKMIHRKLVKALTEKEEPGNNNSKSVINFPKKKKQLDFSVNPIEFEGQVTAAVLEKVPNNPKAPNPAIKLMAYGKLDLKLDDDDLSSEFHLVFRKLEKPFSGEAFDTVVRTIKDTLPSYLIHRLLHFFKVFGSEKIPTRIYTDIDFGDDDESEEEKENSEEGAAEADFPIDTFQNNLDN